jgi:predicted DNA-binding protein YlxM (UPF0122 family)
MNALEAKSLLRNIGLTDKQILALSLWHCDGLTQAEVAAKMGISLDAVKQHCSLAKKNIKKSGNSLCGRFYKQKRPKMLYFEDDEFFTEDKIINWF